MVDWGLLMSALGSLLRAPAGRHLPRQSPTEVQMKGPASNGKPECWWSLQDLPRPGACSFTTPLDLGIQAPVEFGEAGATGLARYRGLRGLIL